MGISLFASSVLPPLSSVPSDSHFLATFSHMVFSHWAQVKQYCRWMTQTNEGRREPRHRNKQEYVWHNMTFHRNVMHFVLFFNFTSFYFTRMKKNISCFIILSYFQSKLVSQRLISWLWDSIIMWKISLWIPDQSFILQWSHRGLFSLSPHEHGS